MVGRLALFGAFLFLWSQWPLYTFLALCVLVPIGMVCSFFIDTRRETQARIARLEHEVYELRTRLDHAENLRREGQYR